jgi:hypothetical protein
MNKYQLGVQVLQRKIKGNRNCQVGVEAALFNRMVKKRLFQQEPEEGLYM